MLEEPTLRKAIEFAVETEKVGAVFYRKLADRFGGDAEIAAVFAQLAQDEEAHEAQFRELMAQVPEDQGESQRRTDRLAMLKIMSRSEFFMGKDGLFRQLERIETRDDALERALRLEKDLLGFYLSLEDILGVNAILAAVIAAEKQHLLKISEYLITGAEMRGLEDDYRGGAPE